MTREQGTPSEVPFISGHMDEPSIIAWKLDALHEKVDRITVPVKDTVRAAMDGLKAAMANLGSRDRGPDPDADIDRDDDFHAVARAFERLADRMDKMSDRPSYSNGNDSDESNWKTIALLVMGFLQALILAFMGYIYTATSQTHDDVIRIKCRLDPQSCMGSANVRP